MSGWNAEGFRKSGLVRGVLCCALLTSFAAAQDGNAAKAPEPMAVFDGQAIYESQLPVGEQAQLQRMLQQVYGVRMRALHAVLDKKLIEAEAKKKDVSVDELYKMEVVSKTADPSEDEVRAYYQSRQAQYKQQPYDSVKDEIWQGLKKVAIQKTDAAYVQGLLQQAMNNRELVLLVSPPKIDVSADPARLRGDSNAAVTIIEFSDFSCSFCKKAESTLNEVLAKYPGKVKVGYRDFPLKQLRPHAEMAAEASRCAGEQGKYWEYHDLLFANPAKEERDDLIADARALKLDEKQFDACLSGGRYKSQVEQDMQLGIRNGVVAAPAFFIDGVLVNGSEPAGVLEKKIDEELSVSGKKSTAP